MKYFYGLNKYKLPDAANLQALNFLSCHEIENIHIYSISIRSVK